MNIFLFQLMNKIFSNNWKVLEMSAQMQLTIWIYAKIATKIHTKTQIGLQSFVNHLTYLFEHEQPVIHIGQRKLFGYKVANYVSDISEVMSVPFYHKTKFSTIRKRIQTKIYRQKKNNWSMTSFC